MGVRAGGDKRGSSADRRARKEWLLAEPRWQGVDTMPGVTCLCAHCGFIIDYYTVEADRVLPGGSYRRDNIQPSCKPCNLSRSNNLDWAGPSARSAACLALTVA